MGALTKGLNVMALLALTAVVAFLAVFQIHSSAKIAHLNNELSTQMKSMHDLQSSLNQMQTLVHHEENEIGGLRKFVGSKFNFTMQNIDAIVNETQTTLNEEVQKVNDDVSSQNNFIAYEFAGIFAVLGTLVFLWHTTSHLRDMNEPFVQRKILAILWMCPIYSVTSWLGLVFTSAEPYLSMIKDFYEAYCIYTFLSFLIAVLGRGDRNAVIDLLAGHADHMKPPLRLCGLLDGGKKYDDDPRAKAEAVLFQCQLFAMQFVLLRPLTSVALVISNALHTGSRDYTSPQFYIIWIINGSIFVAFSGLVKFYHLVREDLKWCNPFPKFLCIKGVVFMTFWQRMVITLIASTALENRFEDDRERREWIQQAQSFLVCIEMLVFAIVHCYVFPVEEWQNDYRPKQHKSNIVDNLALKDFAKDLKYIMKSRKARKRALNKMNREKVRTSDLYLDEIELAQQTKQGGDDTAVRADTQIEYTSEHSQKSPVSSDEEYTEEDIDWERLEKYMKETYKEEDKQEISTNEII